MIILGGIYIYIYQLFTSSSCSFCFMLNIFPVELIKRYELIITRLNGVQGLECYISARMRTKEL